MWAAGEVRDTVGRCFNGSGYMGFCGGGIGLFTPPLDFWGSSVRYGLSGEGLTCVGWGRGGAEGGVF